MSIVPNQRVSHKLRATVRANWSHWRCFSLESIFIDTIAKHFRGTSLIELCAWAIIFILLPFSCVYYPLDSLPFIMQKIAQIFPPVYVFESMRKILIDNQVEFQQLYRIIILNFTYLLLSVLFFLKMN